MPFWGPWRLVDTSLVRMHKKNLVFVFSAKTLKVESCDSWLFCIPFFQVKMCKCNISTPKRPPARCRGRLCRTTSANCIFQMTSRWQAAQGCPNQNSCPDLGEIWRAGWMRFFAIPLFLFRHKVNRCIPAADDSISWMGTYGRDKIFLELVYVKCFFSVVVQRVPTRFVCPVKQRKIKNTACELPLR